MMIPGFFPDLLRPGPPAKFAICIAILCFASCAPEYPLLSPKSGTVRLLSRELTKLEEYVKINLAFMVFSIK